MFIVNYRKIFFSFSIILVLASIFALYYYGFNFGIDFKGGSVLEVSFLEERPSIEVVKSKIENIGFDNFTVSPLGDKNFSVKLKEITQEQKNMIVRSLSEEGNVLLKEERFNSIGPSVGNELKQKAYVAILVVLFCIVLFITFAFRKMTRPINYGIATIIALAHDVIVPTGAYIVFTHFMGGEIDLLFVSAILAILGYSVHDTIVVFDRVRENQIINNNSKNNLSFDGVVGKSIEETFGRSINTSVTIFLSLLALYFIGGDSTKNFALVLLIGVVAGTYSSIFIASPLLVTLEKIRTKANSKK